LSLVGPTTIEPRAGGSTGEHQIVVDFNQNLTGISTVLVTTGQGDVDSFSFNTVVRPSRARGKNAPHGTIAGGNQLIINLKNILDGQRIVVALLGATDGANTADIGIQMSVFLGDVNQNGARNSSDISQVKAQSGKAIDGSNFIEDVTVNGAINSSDIALTKAQSGG
jgi:hypothetical protein